jgi:hypothetical protein
MTLSIGVECYYAECRIPYCYADRHYAECHSDEFHYADCCYDEFHYADCRYDECHYAECRGALFLI